MYKLIALIVVSAIITVGLSIPLIEKAVPIEGHDYLTFLYMVSFIFSVFTFFTANVVLYFQYVRPDTDHMVDEASS